MTEVESPPDNPRTPPAVPVRLEDGLQRLRVTAAWADAVQLDQNAATFYELLLDLAGRMLPG